MCGITGYWSRPDEPEAMLRIVDRMSSAIEHRGPDDHGSWCDPHAGIALGHRRLSILDLSPLGKQPMQSRDGRYYLSYNGEVYNFKALRSELEATGSTFRGSSDTEVLVEAIAHWGLRKTLPKLVGMFAFAVWDRKKRRLLLARDRLGIKPLYYGWSNSTFLFGSDLSSLEQYPGFQGDLSRDAVALFLRFQYVPSPHAIYRNVHKLPPGHLLELTEPNADGRTECWWSAEQSALNAQCHPFEGSPEDALVELDKLLRIVVKDRMISDVPLGAFLSGGIDSSLVVSLMQAQSAAPVKTFTIGFFEEKFNEATHAKAISEYLGTQHTELYVTEKEARDTVPEIPRLWAEPFADSSQIPTYLVSRLARQGVTVSLSGDGGDELFGGYHHYAHTLRNWAMISRTPSVLRKVAGWAGSPFLHPFYTAVGNMIQPLIRAERRPFDLSASVNYRAQLFSRDSIDQLYRAAMSTWQETREVVPGTTEPLTVFDSEELRVRMPNPLERMMLIDSMTFLSGDILEKVDRASMGVSLEARVPLLDHRVFEFAWRLPLNMRVREGVLKWPLREILGRYVPPALFERPKQGFGAPIAKWLRGPLRGWAEELLAPERLESGGVFSPAVVRRQWADLQVGRGPGSRTWAILMFQAWLEHHRNYVRID